MKAVDWFSVRQVRENPSLANPDAWFQVWTALSDGSLQHRLRHYYWLSTTCPKIYRTGFGLLVAEAERRGKPEIVAEAKAWVTKYGAPPGTRCASTGALTKTPVPQEACSGHLRSQLVALPDSNGQPSLKTGGGNPIVVGALSSD